MNQSDARSHKDAKVMVHSTPIKVRGYHLDMYGHVNNARYLEFLEEARWRLFEDYFDVDYWQKRGLGFVAVNINIAYRRPALLDELLEVQSSTVCRLTVRCFR